MKTAYIHRKFTLIELLVVVSILAILVGMLIPVLHRARERSRRSACSMNLKQIGVALQIYAYDFDGFFSYKPAVGPYVEGWQLIDQNYLPEGKVWQCPSAISLTQNPAEASFSKDMDFVWGEATSAKPNFRLDSSWKWRDDGTSIWTPGVPGVGNGYLLSNYQARTGSATMIALNSQTDPADCLLGSDMNLSFAKGISAVSLGDWSNFLLVDGHVEGLEGPPLYDF